MRCDIQRLVDYRPSHGVANCIQVLCNIGLSVGDHLPACVFSGVDQALPRSCPDNHRTVVEKTFTVQAFADTRFTQYFDGTPFKKTCADTLQHVGAGAQLQDYAVHSSQVQHL